MSKHTPGPWFIQGSNVSANYNENGRYPHLLCVHSIPNTNIARQMADARLIAAAPDLLAALNEIYDMPATMVNDSESLRHTIKTIQAIAREAIAKTESEAA